MDDRPIGRNLVKQLPQALDASGSYFFFEHVYHLPEMLRCAEGCGPHGPMEQLAERIPTSLATQRFARTYGGALLAEARGEHAAAAAGFADAAAGWHQFEVPYEEAQALLGEGRCLVALGRAPEAAPVLDLAREIFARLGAKPALEETAALLSRR